MILRSPPPSQITTGQRWRLTRSFHGYACETDTSDRFVLLEDDTELEVDHADERHVYLKDRGRVVRVERGRFEGLWRQIETAAENRTGSEG